MNHYPTPGPGRLFPVLVLLLTAAALFPSPSVRAQIVDEESEQAPASAEAREPVVTKAPKLIHFEEAVYPPDAKAAGLSGAVGLVVDIDETGKVLNALVDEPAGNGFDEAAVAAARLFRFEPAELDNKPAPVRIHFTYRFKVEKKFTDGKGDAPGQTLEGQIREKGVRIPIPGVEVLLDGTGFKVTTDRKGRFSFQGVPPGEYKIIITAPKYKQFIGDVKVVENQALTANFNIEPLTDNPYRTVIVGKKVEAMVTKYTLEERTFETVPGTFGDPIRVIQSLPGVARTPFNTGFLVIRGAAPSESSVYLDGIQIPLLYHFLGGPSVLHPSFLSDIGYYPGNFPVKYGESTAGVVDIKSKGGKVKQFHGDVDINLLNLAAYVETPIGDKVSARFAIRRSYIDWVLALAMDAADESGFMISPVYYDYQGKITWDVGPKDRLSVFIFGSDDQLKFTAADEEQDVDLDLSMRTSFHRLALEWMRSTKTLRFKVKPFIGYDYFTFGATSVFVDASVYMAGARGEISWIPTDWFRLTVGADGGFGRTDMSGVFPTYADYYIPGSTVVAQGRDSLSDETIDFARGDNYGVYATYVETSIKPWKQLEILPGVRVAGESHPGGSNVWIDPRLVVRFTPLKPLTIKGGAGIFSRGPDFNMTDKEYGNPDLTEQWSDQYSLGLEWEIWGPIFLDTQVFYLRRHDQAVFTDAVEVTENGQERVMFDNIGRGRSIGTETILKYRPDGPFYGWVAYTFSKSESSEAPDLPYTIDAFDQTHILSVVASYRLGRGWEAGLRYRFVSGMPATPVNDSVYVTDQSSYGPTMGPLYSSRAPSFQQLDARIEKIWTFESWMFSTYLDIQNVTNYTNSEFLIWDYRFKDSWYVPSIPFLPTIGFSGRW